MCNGILERYSGMALTWNAHLKKPSGMNNLEMPCGGEAPAVVVPLGAWSPMTL